MAAGLTTERLPPSDTRRYRPSPLRPQLLPLPPLLLPLLVHHRRHLIIVTAVEVTAAAVAQAAAAEAIGTQVATGALRQEVEASFRRLAVSTRRGSAPTDQVTQCSGTVCRSL
jgi:hypothetical protein